MGTGYRCRMDVCSIFTVAFWVFESPKVWKRFHTAMSKYYVLSRKSAIFKELSFHFLWEDNCFHSLWEDNCDFNPLRLVDIWDESWPTLSLHIHKQEQISWFKVSFNACELYMSLQNVRHSVYGLSAQAPDDQVISTAKRVDSFLFCVMGEMNMADICIHQSSWVVFVLIY